MHERHKYPRPRVLKGAKLVVGKSLMFDCAVCNLTDQGARIEIPNAIVLPELFRITFDDGRLGRACRIVWRRVCEAGIEYAEICGPLP